MKTASEEAADWIESSRAIDRFGCYTSPKRLRAEGRELRRYRRLALAADGTPAYLVIRSLMREALRIQKARKK